MLTFTPAEQVHAPKKVANAAPQLRNLYTPAWLDILNGLLFWQLWTRLGWQDIKRRYRRTLIGPFWGAASLLVFVIAVGGLGSHLLGRHSPDYLPYLASGMIVWVMLSSNITESCSVFVGGSNLIRQMRFDYSILVYAQLWRNLLAFVHNLPVYLLVFLLFAPEKLTLTALWAIPMMLLLLINCAWITLLLGLFALRFRDVQPFVQSMVQITMFATPIFWPADRLEGMGRVIYVGLNPFYHLITIVRAPLLGELPPVNSLIAVMIITIVGWGITYPAFSFFRKRISYWI